MDSSTPGSSNQTTNLQSQSGVQRNSCIESCQDDESRSNGHAGTSRQSVAPWHARLRWEGGRIRTSRQSAERYEIVTHLGLRLDLPFPGQQVRVASSRHPVCLVCLKNNTERRTAGSEAGNWSRVVSKRVVWPRRDRRVMRTGKSYCVAGGASGKSRDQR